MTTAFGSSKNGRADFRLRQRSRSQECYSIESYIYVLSPNPRPYNVVVRPTHSQSRPNEQIGIVFSNRFSGLRPAILDPSVRPIGFVFSNRVSVAQSFKLASFFH